MRIRPIAAAVVALASTATAQEGFNYAYGDEVCEAVSFLEDDDYILVSRGRFTSRVNIRDEIDQTFASIGEAIRRGLGIRLSEVDRLNPDDYPYMVSGPGGQRTATEDAETALDIACGKAIEAHTRRENVRRALGTDRVIEQNAAPEEDRRQDDRVIEQDLAADEDRRQNDPETVYRADEARLTIPRVLRDVTPQYTAEAMEARIQGTVWVDVVVLPTGEVGDVTVTKSLDQVYGLDQQAVAAARQWLFAPGRRNGEPVSTVVTLELFFNLR